MADILDLDPLKAEKMAAMLRAVAHPVRLQLLARLRQGEDTVGHLAEVLKVPQSVVSNHLAVLRLNGLVSVKRSKGYAWYAANMERLREVFACLQGRADGPGLEEEGQ